MGTTLPLYWNLSSLVKKDRIDASAKLVAALEQFQTYLVPKVVSENSDDSDQSDDNTDDLDIRNAPDVSYAIRRLIRGLASPRESSRLGFAVALTELLSRIDTVSCKQIVTLIEKASQTTGSMSGQEERDMLFARLFGLTSVIRSGLLVREQPLASSSIIPSSLDSFELVINSLILLSEKKSWLRESCWWSIITALEVLNASQVSWKLDAIKFLVKAAFTGESSWSPEKLSLALRIRIFFPKKDFLKLSSPFKSSDPLETSNLQAVSRILKDAGSDDDEETGPKTSAADWKPQLHFVWDDIFDALLPSSETKSTKGTFSEFFRIVVDENLFAASSSPKRKYWGFQVFQKAISRVSSTDLPLLFTKNFMRSWINHMSNQDRYLHKIAKQVAADVHNAVVKDPSIGFSLVLQLTGTNGSQRFDRITKTKTVENILASTDSSGIRDYVALLFSQVNQTEEADSDSRSSTESRRSWIIEQLAALLRHGSIAKEDDWVLSILHWFVVHGFFNVTKKTSKSKYHAVRSLPDPSFTKQHQELCRTKLYSSLAELSTQTVVIKEGEESKKARAKGVTSAGEFWISSVLEAVVELQEDHKHVELVSQLSAPRQEILKKANKAIRKLAKLQAEAARGGELLLAALTLKCFESEGSDEGEVDILESCVSAVNTLFLGRASKSEDTDAPPPIDTLVDIIIGLLENSNAFSRTVANQAFSMVSSLVEESTISLIATQLERRDPALDTADIDEEDDNEDGEEEDEDDDEEEESDSNADEDEEDEAEDEDEAKLQKLKEALEASGAGVDEDDDSSVVMDDDQMMQIDEQLAAVFRARKSEKSSGKDNGLQREATYFKNRVLDLVDIFMKKQSSSAHNIRLILPLVELVGSSGQDEQQVANKAGGLIRTHLGKSKAALTGVEETSVLKTLETLHTKARKARTSAIASTISICSVYLTKTLAESNQEALCKIYADSLKDFAVRKGSALPPSFFSDFIQRCPELAWTLRTNVLDASDQAVNGYRRVHLFEFTHLLLTRLPDPNARQKDINAFSLKLNEKLQTALSDSMTNEDNSFSVAQAKDLLKVAHQVVQWINRTKRSQALAFDMWNAEPWNDILVNLDASERFKGATSLQNMCKQIIKVCNANKVVDGEQSKSTSKRKEVGDVVDDAEKRKKRKKVKKSHKALDP